MIEALSCLANPLSCAPDWLIFILGYWEWLLAAFLLGLGIGALAGWKGLLVAVSGGLALIWLRRRPAGEPDYEDGGDKPFRKPAPRTGKRRFDPTVGERGAWQRQNPVTGKWENE